MLKSSGAAVLFPLTSAYAPDPGPVPVLSLAPAAPTEGGVSVRIPLPLPLSEDESSKTYTTHSEKFVLQKTKHCTVPTTYSLIIIFLKGAASQF